MEFLERAPSSCIVYYCIVPLVRWPGFLYHCAKKKKSSSCEVAFYAYVSSVNACSVYAYV